MTGARPAVFVVDDDAAIRDALLLLLETAGFVVKTFSNGMDFLASIGPQTAGCLLLDVRMPQMTGPELQRELLNRGINLPIIFLTGYGDIPLVVKTIQAGAVDFLTKPVSSRRLLDCVHAALALDVKQRQLAAANRQLCERLEGLTEREHEVLELAIDGYPNKKIAKFLGISIRTVEHHRSNILLKTGAANLLELARWVDACR